MDITTNFLGHAAAAYISNPLQSYGTDALIIRCQQASTFSPLMQSENFDISSHSNFQFYLRFSRCYSSGELALDFSSSMLAIVLILALANSFFKTLVDH